MFTSFMILKSIVSTYCCSLLLKISNSDIPYRCPRKTDSRPVNDLSPELTMLFKVLWQFMLFLKICQDLSIGFFLLIFYRFLHWLYPIQNIFISNRSLKILIIEIILIFIRIC